VGIPFALGPEPQGEAIGWSADGSSFYTASESIGSAIYRFTFEPTLYGDYNDDRVVNAADYTLWRNLLGADVELPNDETPGSVREEDYCVWKSHFGESLNEGESTGASAFQPGGEGVPEPVSLVLLALGAGSFLLRTRRPSPTTASGPEE
jgi:hypothetical protein